MNVYDLTGPITDGLCFYGPPVTPVRLETFATLAGQGWEAQRFEMTTLSGTYLETSKHCFAGRRSIDQVAPAELLLSACLLRIPRAPAQAITPADLAQAARAAAPRPGEAILIATGWDARWGRPEFDQESPYLTREAMDWLLAQGPALIGGDMPSFDSREAPAGVVAQLFAADVLLLAPLVGLMRLPADRFRLIALPLKLTGAAGAPCRAVAVFE